jgi:membrane protein
MRELGSALNGIVSVFKEAYRRFEEHECAIRAAGLAYYGLLSIFPLLLFLVFIGTQVLASEAAREALQNALNQLTPQTADLLENVVEQSIHARGSIGVIGALGLLWGASAVFGMVSSTLNMIWETELRSFWRRRLVALISVMAISGLFLFSLFLSFWGTWTRLPGARFTTWRWVNQGLSLLVSMFLFWLIYRSLPNRRVDGRAALIAGFLAACLWQLVKAGFGWFLTSGLARYGLVYSSLASLIVLVIWLYLSAFILLIGAVFAASLEHTFWPQDVEPTAS